MASLLVIGGTGFFGKSILDAFQRGLLDEWKIDRVIAMSRHAEQLIKVAPELVDERVELLNADIGYINWLPPADYVIHAAASTDARNYLSRPEAERQNIQAGVRNYCRLAPKYNSRSKIVYVSSGAVYGTQPTGLDNIDENYEVKDAADLPEGKRDYAIAKREAEEAFKALGGQGLNVSVARCFAFVGRWLPRDQHFAIGNFIEDGLQGRAIEIKATSHVYRSYMYADDLVLWLMTLLLNADANCEVYNVGSDSAVSIVDLADKVAKYFDVPVIVPLQTGCRVDRYIPSVEKAKFKLGLKFEQNLDQLISDTVKCITENEKCFKA